VLSVARSSHASQSRCFSVGQVALNSGDQNQLIRRSRGLSRRSAPRIARITRDADYTDNMRRPITRTTRATDHTDNTARVPGRPVFSVARSSHASQFGKLSVGQVALHSGDQTSLFVDPRGFSPKCVTDNTGRGLHGQHGSVCRDGQCSPWPDRRTRVSPGVFRGPGSAALRGSTNLYGRSEGLSRRRAPRITRTTRATDHTDNMAPCAGNGQCFPWPDRRTRASSSAFRGPGCPGLRRSNQPNRRSEVLSHRVHAWRGSISIRLRSSAQRRKPL
jgi:hypothetical protein